MEFGRREERPQLYLIESAVLELCISERSEIEGRKHCHSVQPVCLDVILRIQATFQHLSKDLYIFFCQFFCLFVLLSHPQFFNFFILFLTYCSIFSFLHHSNLSTFSTSHFYPPPPPPSSVARLFGRRGNHSLQCQQGAELLSPVINWLSNKNISLRYNQGLIQAGHLCVRITMEAYALPLQLCYF